jgi:hypothetical protein
MDIQNHPSSDTRQDSSVELTRDDSLLNKETSNSMMTIEGFKEKLRKGRRQIKVASTFDISHLKKTEKEKFRNLKKIANRYKSIALNSNSMAKVLFIIVPLLLFFALIIIYILSQDSDSKTRQRSLSFGTEVKSQKNNDNDKSELL